MITIRIAEATDEEASRLADLIRGGFRDVAERISLTPENCPTHPSNYTPERVHREFERGAKYYIAEVNGNLGARPQSGDFERQVGSTLQTRR